MVQVQINIKLPDGLAINQPQRARLEVNILRREDATEAEIEVAKAFEDLTRLYIREIVKAGAAKIVDWREIREGEDT